MLRASPICFLLISCPYHYLVRVTNARSKQSLQGRYSVIWAVYNGALLIPCPTPSWSTTACWLSVTATLNMHRPS
jgi:hypothetical protein